MSTQETLPTTESRLEQPVVFYGGFNHDQLRNERALEYIASKNIPTAKLLPDPEVVPPEFNNYIVAKGAAERRLTAREAARYMGDTAVSQSVSMYQVQRAQALNAHNETIGTPSVNAIFQSADALMGLQAMLHKPKGYQNVVLAFPAGLARQPRISRASYGVAMSSLKSRQAARRLAPEDDYEAHLRTGPKPRTPADRVIAPSVALSYQAPVLHEIRRGSHAPGISLVLGLKDYMIPPDKVMNELQSANDVDYILISNTPHGINGNKRLMDKTLELLEMTDRARQDRGAGVPALPLVQRICFDEDVPESKREELLRLAAEIEHRTNQAK